MLHKSFKPAKCKTALNLAKSRMKLMKNKKDVQMKQSRREVAQLLQSGQDQTARIRVEHVVREEKTIAAYEMIEIYCELIVARLPIIESQKVCPLDLKEAITSLIFAAPRCADIPELQDVRKHFTAKYGKEFVAAATELRPACGVSRTLIEKLSVKAPDGPLKVKILKGIAEEHNIQWEPNWFKDDPISSDYSVQKMPHTDNSNTTQIQQQQPQPSNTIQMNPLNAQIADDLEENHSHLAKKAEVSAQRLAHANINETPPSSTSRPDFSPSGNVSGGMLSSQSSGTAQNSFSADRQHWNMEFKDATAAAQAAAESAERASMAARAAAELSIRDSYRPGLSSVHGENDGNGRYAGSVLQHKHEQGNPINSSFDQRSPRMERHQRTTSQHSDITGGRDGRSSNTHSHSEVPYDTKRQEFRESESTSNRVSADTIRQSTASASIPSSSKGDYYSSTSSNIQEYEAEPAENPFYGETVEPLNRPSRFYSQSSGYEDEYGAFSNAKYDDIDSDSSFVVLGQGTSEEDNWHAKTTYLSKSNSIKDETIYKNYGERNVFEKSDEQRYGFDSGTGVFAGMDQEPSGLDINDKVGHHVANAVFDNSCSDDDEEFILDPAGKVKSPSGDFSPRHGLPHKDNPYFEPDLSESFRKSPIYSKLIEPLPVTFDDYDAPSPKSEKELQTENSEPDIGSYNYRKPDWDSDATTEFIGSSFVEKTDDSFLSSKKMEDNQKAYVGTIGRGKDSESLRSLRLSSEAKDHPEFDDETHSSSDEGGVELNLGSLLGGQRNRPSWGSPYSRDRFAGVSSPSRYSEAAANGGFGEEEDSEQGSMPYKGRSNHKSVFAPPPLNTAERTESGTIHENVHKTRAKDPTGYFEYDDSAPEEDAAKPAINKNLQGAGISRRTRGSARLVSSRPSRNLGDAIKTGQFSSSTYATDGSPKSRHRTSAESSLKDDTTSELRSETKLSRNSNSSPPDAVEKPATPESPRISRASVSSEKAPSRENSGKLPSHVHPKLPDFETFTAHLQSLRTNRQ